MVFVLLLLFLLCCFVFGVFFFFFFQAEDGIRDLVRSRGLGDVYKRQERRPRRRLHVYSPNPSSVRRRTAFRPSSNYRS